ncbi:MAG: flagellar motor switch protein FliM [Thermoleophilaceae bacterium]|nr:flagellar motor switch protein FliM [Thermoleophilaceae bacterium]
MQERNPLEGAALGADAQFGARPEIGPRQARVQEIDFRRPTKFPRDLVRRLEHAHESFCRTASSGLSAELRTSFELAVAGSEQLPYGTAMAETDQDALLAVLNVKPLDTEVAMLVEMPLALRLVDRLLGGGGKARDEIPDSLTDLEVVIVKRAVQSLVEPLSATWLDLADVHFEIDSMQTSPMTFQLVPPSEPVLMLHLEARIDGLVSPIVMCMPYRSVEPIVDKLEHRHFTGQVMDPGAARKVQAAISGIDVELRVEVGAVDLKVSDVLGLGVGDVVRLRRQADKGMIVYAGDVPTYVATPGRNGNARAVQIRGAWERGR